MQSLQPVATGTYELRRAPPPMRALVVASDKEEGGGGLLADAAARSAPSSGSQSAEAERNAALRILFVHWFKPLFVACIGEALERVSLCAEVILADDNRGILRGVDLVREFLR